MTLPRFLAAGAIAIAAMSGVASAEEGRIYVFHSKATGACPSLDWHVMLGADNSLSGMIAWDDMKAMARATGTANMHNKTFQMTAREVGGKGRTATITGTVGGNGWLTANIKGPKIDCQNINVPWFSPPPPTGG